jgi:hypothetical protein
MVFRCLSTRCRSSCSPPIYLASSISISTRQANRLAKVDHFSSPPEWSGYHTAVTMQVRQISQSYDNLSQSSRERQISDNWQATASTPPICPEKERAWISTRDTIFNKPRINAKHDTSNKKGILIRVGHEIIPVTSRLRKIPTYSEAK